VSRNRKPSTLGLETRKLLERAKRVLQREFQLNEEEGVLSHAAREPTATKAMRKVAEAILLAVDMRRGS
jgi:AmiR/NasT family two-component response regulator